MLRFELRYRGALALAGLIFSTAAWAQATPTVPEIASTDSPRMICVIERIV
jgi:hypothetical protein